jgi:tetratricopeptide (TPR) repeat protein
MRSALASKIAFAALLAGAVGVLVWWTRHRPSFLLYQAHDQLGKGNQAGVISEYQRLLKRPGLSPADEIKLRLALGELYVAAVQESSEVDVLSAAPGYSAENPFVDLAKKEFQRVLELDPSNSAAHDYMGRILWSQRLENYALDEFQKSRSLDPRNPEPLRFLAQIHLGRGDAALARDEALQALALSPAYDEARLTLVSCYSELGDTPSALDEYERLSPAFRSGPDAQSQYALLLMQAHRWSQALQVFNDAIQRNEMNGRLQIAHGRYWLERGSVREASAAFAQAAAMMPRSAWPIAWSAAAFSLNGDCEQSDRASQRLLESLPRWPWSHWARAWSRLCSGQTEEAVASLDEALRLSPDFSEALELKSSLLLDMGRNAELGELLRPLIDREQRRSFVYTKMAESLLDLGKPGMALEVAETAAKFDPSNPDALVALGRARRDGGDSAGAQRAFTEALRIDQDNLRLRAYATPTESSDGQWSQILSELARNGPDASEIWCLLGDAFEKNNEFGRAVDAYESAAAAKPYLLKAQLGLIAAHHKLRQPDAAAAACRRAFQISPHNPNVLAWRTKLRLR